MENMVKLKRILKNNIGPGNSLDTKARFFVI